MKPWTEERKKAHSVLMKKIWSERTPERKAEIAKRISAGNLGKPHKKHEANSAATQVSS